jgi:hypothetical protein
MEEMTELKCKYRFEIGREGSKPMVSFGGYIEVTPPSRLIWTNEESEDGASLR